ncbi:MAG: hypothetical protein A2Z02_03960 [Chloroflexi bacterium RBG_16_48_7]|nr:MAG: hypothetical protein A2Z02_03960 [Chloroflexi bacterium RBG_16_48_7]
MGHYNSFLIRVWTEDGKEVRGSIQHVGTQETVHFNRWDRMVGFISDHLNWQIGRDAEPGKSPPTGSEIAEKP